MVTQNSRDKINAQWKQISLIWFVLFFSMGMAAVVIYFVGQDLHFSANLRPYSFLQTIVYGLSMIQFFGLMILRRSLLKRLKENLDHKDRPSPRDERASTFLAGYKKVVLLCGGLSESFLIYGSVLYFMFRDLNSYVILLTFSVLSLYICRPRLNEIKRIFIPHT